MTKKILFMSTAKLTSISIGLLLVVFCTIGMSFTPVEEEVVEIVNDTTSVSGPQKQLKKSHWTTSGSCGSTNYHNKTDYARTIAQSMNAAWGTVAITANTKKVDPVTAADGSQSYVEWDTGLGTTETTDQRSDLEAIHTNTITFTATPTDPEEYYFIGWYSDAGGTTLVSEEGESSWETAVKFDSKYYTYSSSHPTDYESNRWTVTYYAKFAQIPAINVTFLAASTPARDNGYYTVAGKGVSETITTSNQTIGVKGITLTAYASEMAEFVRWYTEDGAGNRTTISEENPCVTSFTEATKVGVEWRELTNNHTITFLSTDLDGSGAPIGSYTVNAQTVNTSNYVYNTGAAYKFQPTMTATAASGYLFTGWYTKHGKKKDLLSTANPWNPTFTQDSTIYAGFAYNGYTDDQKAQFKVGSTYYTDLNAANTAAKNGSNKTIVCTRDGILPPGNYTISSGVSLLIPYSTSESLQTKPVKVNTTASATAISAYRKLTFTEGAYVVCDGNIYVGGQADAGNGGNPSGYVTGPCGMIDMSAGGHIDLNGKLYCWGFIKGQDWDQGNNTLDVGTITANSGAEIWEDFAVGDWRGGTATTNFEDRFFPFQSYFIQNIEVPVTYKYGSSLKNFFTFNMSSSAQETSFTLIGSGTALFKLKDSKSTVRKWYDPTTDLMCYELSGSAVLDQISLKISIATINSSDYDLPINSNMHLILTNCDLTLNSPLLIQPGGIVEVKEDARVTLSTKIYLYDKDEWGPWISGKYYRSYGGAYPIPTLFKKRGDGATNDGIDDAKIIVDGTLTVSNGYGLFSSGGGADVMGNGGGKIVFPSSLLGATSVKWYKGTKTSGDGELGTTAMNVANLCNDDASYTKAIKSTTFYNVNGRWFAASAKDEKANHTYDFTYISSGAVSGTGGTSSTTDAVYSWDKTGLELRQKWANVTYSCEGTDENDNTHYWWHGQGEQSSWFYNWTLNSDWHQFMPTATEGMYSGSNNKIYTKTDCVWEELGETDVNCLYEIGGVKKALVDGQFIALEPNNNDPAYHAADDATKYYICFSGCNWHEATKYENAEKAYVVDEDIFIWYDGAWMNAEWRDPFFYTLDETDVPIYYEYLNGEWVLSDPYIRVTDGLENRTYWFLDEAFAFASGAVRKTPTIKILRDISGITTAVSYTGANKTCTLDLNGHSITGSVSSMLTINGAGCTFIIEDNNTEGKEGKINLYYSYNGRRYAVNVTKGHLKLKSGTISSINTLPYATGQTSTTSCAIIVKASQQCTIEGGKVYAQADHNPFGIYGDGNSSTITVKGGEVIASVGAKSEPRGIQVTGGTLNVQDDAVIEATTYAGGTTGEGILVNQTASYHATLNMTGGTVKSTTKNSSIGVYVNCTYTYDTNEPRTITAWSRAEAYISGGEIRVENKNGATAEGVRSLGTTEISGGKITVRPTTSTAIGVRLYDGTTTIKGTADIDVAATSVAYGVRISEEAPANKAGTVYNGTLNMTGGTLTVRTTGTTDAYGVYVGAASTKITTTHASNSSYYAGNYANAGTANISNAVIDVQAKTNKAYSVYVENPVSESGATGYATATATPNCSITGGKFKVASMTASATDIAATNVSTSTYTISGGYYNNQENVAGYTVAPKHVVTLPTTDANYPEYLYKVANSYLVTFMNESELLQSTYQEEGKIPTYIGAEPKKASAGGYSYEFDGWSTTNGGAPSALTAVTSAGATYYAHFAETDLRYTISLNSAANGGECAQEYIRVVPGAAAGTLPSATKEGHTFIGWFTAATGGTQLAESTIVSGDITYYALFSVNSYTLTYALGDGKVSTAGSPIPAKNQTGTQSQSVAYGTVITAPAVTRTGYTFQSWDAIIAPTMPAENVTYTPLWIPNVNTKYTVKHYLQNVDGTYPTNPIETQSLTGTTASSVTPDVKSYDGFVSPAAQTVTIAAAGTTVVEYQYARRHYTFTLDAYTNGGTSDVPSIEVIHGATIGAVPPDAQKGCNDFTGWYTQPVGGVKITPEFVIEYDMKTLYAQFSDDVRTYPITYNAGANGTGTVTAGTKTCGVNTTLSSSTFTREGYTQIGWSLTDGGAQAYALGGTYTENAALTLYPVWTVVTYNLTYEGLNGATNSNPATYTIETATITLANPGTRVGYTFTGWTCGGSPLTQIELGSTGDKVITANWEKIGVTILWKSEDGTEMLETDEGVEIGAAPSFDGTTPTKATTEAYTYTFDGWTTSIGGDVVDPLPTVSAAATYYAHFTATANVASVTVGGSTTYYTDFATAWAFVNEQSANTTIKLLQDATAEASLVFTPAAAMTCTLDLNNHTLSGEFGRLIDINLAGSTFVITDNSVAKGGKVSNNYSENARVYGVVLTAGTLKLQSGTISSTNPHTYSTAAANKSSAATAVYVAAGQTFTMENGTVESASQYASYAIYMAAGTSTVTIKNGLVKGRTTKSTTAAGIYNLGKGLTVDGGRIVGHAYTTTAYGIYLYGGHGTINGGTIEATNDTTNNKGTTTTYGIYVNYKTSTYKGVLTIPSTSTVNVFAKARTTTAYAIVVGGGSTGNTIAGGTFTAKTMTSKTAYCVNSSGNITISGGTFTANAATTNAYGIYAPRGTVTVNGNPTFNVTAGTTTAYGALAYGTIGKKGTGKYSGTIEINGGTFNVTSTAETAWGAYAGLASRDLRSCSATNDTVPGLHYMPGTLVVNDGTFNVKATTTGAFGIVVANAKSESGTVGTTARIPLGTVTGGKFKVESMGDANATAYAMNSATTAARLVVQGGYYNTKRTDASETSNIEDKYTAPTKDCNYHVLPLTGEDPYKYEVAEAYTITFNVNGHGAAPDAQLVKKNQQATEPSTPIAEGYTFGGWYKEAECTNAWNFISDVVTENQTLYAKWTIANIGPKLDIVDWTSDSLTLNLNGIPAAGWPYTINNVVYYKDEATAAGSTNYRAADRTLTIPYSGSADDNLSIEVRKKTVTGDIYSRHTYMIPHVYSSSETLNNENINDINENSILFVNSGTLTITYTEDTVRVNAIYVAPGAELKVNTDVKLRVDSLMLRTTPWEAAILDNQGTISSSKTYYTRKIADNTKYYQFAIPLASDVKNVRLSNNSKCTYNTSWMLKSYNEESRANNGAVNTETISNWDLLTTDGEGHATILGSVGYEMFSNTPYYREYYFPVALPETEATEVGVSYHSGEAGPNHAGWNALCSPLMGKYSQTSRDPSERLKISQLNPDGTYQQTAPNIISPAVPFYYQASDNGKIYFNGDAMIFYAPRRAWNAYVPTQWMQLAISNLKGDKLDETSIYAHPEKFAPEYETGYDVAKQSLTGGKALIYSELPCGKLAFAAVPDSLAENRIPITVNANEEGEFLFSLMENNYLGRLQHVLLHDMQNGFVTDLLERDYSAKLNAGTNAGRFYIQCVFAAEAPAVTTGVNSVESNDDAPQKIMYKNKVYIIYQGRVYDMTGRQCELK